MSPARIILLLAATVWPHATPHGVSVTATPTKDNTLYAESDTLSNGAGQRFFAGRAGTGHARRALIAFDLNGLVPSGATVDSVVLQLSLAQTSAGTRTVSLHRVLGDWGEGTSAASMGEGAVRAPRRAMPPGDSGSSARRNRGQRPAATITPSPAQASPSVRSGSTPGDSPP